MNGSDAEAQPSYRRWQAWDVSLETSSKHTFVQPLDNRDVAIVYALKATEQNCSFSHLAPHACTNMWLLLHYTGITWRHVTDAADTCTKKRFTFLSRWLLIWKFVSLTHSMFLSSCPANLLYSHKLISFLHSAPQVIVWVKVRSKSSPGLSL